MAGQAKAPSAVGAGDFDEQLGRAELSEPESDVRRRRGLAMLEIVGSTSRRIIGQSLSRCVFLVWTRSGNDTRSHENPSGRMMVVRRAHSAENGATPRIQDMTSTRM